MAIESLLPAEFTEADKDTLKILRHMVVHGTVEDVGRYITLLGSEKAKAAIALLDERGWTVLHLAFDMRRRNEERREDLIEVKEIVKKLLGTLGTEEAKRLITLPGGVRRLTPLHLAMMTESGLISDERFEIVKELVNALGEDRYARAKAAALPDAQGTILLHLAVESGREDLLGLVVGMLGDDFCRVATLRDSDGVAPMHSVAAYCEEGVVRSFIRRLGVDFKTHGWWLSKAERAKVKAATRAVLEEFLQQAVSGQHLTHKRLGFCLEHRHLFLQCLLDHHKSDRAVLDDALNQNTALGEVFWTQRSNGCGMFNGCSGLACITNLRTARRDLLRAEQSSLSAPLLMGGIN